MSNCIKGGMLPVLKEGVGLNTHLLLLLQASVGVPLAAIGIYSSEQATVFNWFCIIILFLDYVIVVYSFLHIMKLFCGKKSEYEDIEQGNNSSDEVMIESVDLTRKLLKLKKDKKKLRKMNTELEKKQREFEEMKKEEKGESKSLYGGYGYCNYGHYHQGAPVNNKK